jgi:hypothetical protein
MMVNTAFDVFLFDIAAGAFPSGPVSPALAQNSPFYGLVDGATVDGVPHFAANTDAGFVFGPKSLFSSGNVSSALVQFPWDFTLQSDVEPTGRYIVAIGLTYTPETLYLHMYDRSTFQELRMELAIPGNWYSSLAVSVSSVRGGLICSLPNSSSTLTRPACAERTCGACKLGIRKHLILRR